MDEVERAAQITIIGDHMARIAHATDYGTLEEYGALLAEDVVWEVPPFPNFALPGETRRGRADAIIGARERREHGTQGPGSHTLHVVTNVAVTPGDGVAEAKAYWHYFGGIGQAPHLRGSGTYEDRYVLTPSGWLLAHRRISAG